MRVADYIANFIYDQLGVKDVFLLTGGGAMFLNDGVAKHPHLRAVCNHHEQACAMGAFGYARYNDGFGVCMTTSGCGSTNTITGLLDAWQDHIPMLFISGQVKRKETCYNSPLPLRQAGIQEANIVKIVESITKYSIMINEPHDIAYHLEKAKFLAEQGRPGPVWLDIPQDVQGAPIDVSKLRHFDPSELEAAEPPYRGYALSPTLQPDDLASITSALSKAKRPVILVGNGVRLAGASDAFRDWIAKAHIPVVASYLGVDIMDNDHADYLGPAGIKGDRAANFAMQNADLLLILGCRLAVGVTGFEYELFAREATKIVVDVDAYEHQKPSITIDHFVHADAKDVITALAGEPDPAPQMDTHWRPKLAEWKARWSIPNTDYDDMGSINMYTFFQRLQPKLPADAVVMSDAGSAYYVTAQAMRPVAQQRFITSGAQAEMGFTLPATIGAAVAKQGEVIGITGDGSLQLNIQEFQTLVYSQAPVKLCVFNNNGYLSIRATQRKFFEERYLGTDEASGITFPDLQKITEAYGLTYVSARTPDELDIALDTMLAAKGPVICEVFTPQNQEILPSVSSAKRADGSMVSKPLEDMYPFLTREEFLAEMIVEPVAE